MHSGRLRSRLRHMGMGAVAVVRPSSRRMGGKSRNVQSLGVVHFFWAEHRRGMRCGGKILPIDRERPFRRPHARARRCAAGLRCGSGDARRPRERFAPHLYDRRSSAPTMITQKNGTAPCPAHPLVFRARRAYNRRMVRAAEQTPCSLHRLWSVTRFLDRSRA